MRQKSIEIEGLHHRTAPIPMACRVGPILATSGVMGTDAATGKMPADVDGQALHCFRNLELTLKAGGLDLGDVVKLTVFVTDDNNRQAVNKYWTQCYPDPNKRPARHTLVMPLRGGMLVQLEALAVAKEI
jgi:2-iminobutanoate/2-iminopropanoate deaminase